MQKQDPSILDKALMFAVQAHAGQLDQSGEPYILHPIRVMNSHYLYQNFSGDDLLRARIVALWHDILEDTNYKSQDLIDVLSDNGNNFEFAWLVAQEVEQLSKREDEHGFTGYIKFVKRIRDEGSKVVIATKKSDIDDNSDPRRLVLLDENKIDHLYKKYLQAKKLLGMI